MTQRRMVRARGLLLGRNAPRVNNAARCFDIGRLRMCLVARARAAIKRHGRHGRRGMPGPGWRSGRRLPAEAGSPRTAAARSMMVAVGQGWLDGVGGGGREGGGGRWEEVRCGRWEGKGGGDHQKQSFWLLRPFRARMKRLSYSVLTRLRCFRTPPSLMLTKNPTSIHPVTQPWSSAALKTRSWSSYTGSSNQFGAQRTGDRLSPVLPTIYRSGLWRCSTPPAGMERPCHRVP